jgi:tRNA-uridine 2-sulfurtransferase
LLYSGGLDSILAASILMEQGIDLIGLFFLLPFFPPDYNFESSAPARCARSAGLSVRLIRCGMDYMRMVERPKHGYGKRMNPCIDCKIFFLKEAKRVMLEEGASFVATGEVVGQRPMSQMKHMLNHIEKESELKGYLLRPLSAQLLKPTLAELNGTVDRQRLLSISGRSRSEQMKLAEKYSIQDHGAPAGGCLFTDRHIAGRVADLLSHHSDYDMTDVYLLTVGRHFRINDRVKAIVARNEQENLILEKYSGTADAYMVPEFKGPSVYARGDVLPDDIGIMAGFIVRYGKPPDGEGCKILVSGRNRKSEMTAGGDRVLDDSVLDTMRI